MRVVEITVVGQTGRMETLSRRDDQLVVKGAPVFNVAVGDSRDVRWSAAQSLHRMLEGYIGTNSDVDDYMKLLDMLAV